MTLRLPLESSPSPDALTLSVPPLMRTKQSEAEEKESFPWKPPKPLLSFPPAALRPSSLETTLVSPPLTVMLCPSMPS